MKNLEKTAVFLTGGGTYVGLELMYRGRSHWTMFVLGGGCFLALGKLSRRLHPLARMAAGSGICTAGELAVGLLFNRAYTIWAYRSLPMNYRGQICLAYSLLWGPLSLAAMALYRQLSGDNRRK